MVPQGVNLLKVNTSTVLLNVDVRQYVTLLKCVDINEVRRQAASKRQAAIAEGWRASERLANKRATSEGAGNKEEGSAREGWEGCTIVPMNELSVFLDAH